MGSAAGRQGPTIFCPPRVSPRDDPPSCPPGRDERAGSIATAPSSWPGESAKRVFALDDPAIHVFLATTRAVIARSKATKQSRIRTNTLDCFACARNDVYCACVHIPATYLPELLPTIAPEIEGRRECRAFDAPIASRANEKSTRASHHRSHRRHPAFPARMGVTVSFVVSPETGLSCLRRLRTKFASLIPASGYQDATTSPSASSAFRQARRPRPSHPAPTFVTIAKRPLNLGGMRRIVRVFLVRGEAEFFCDQDWTGRNSLNRHDKFDFWRTSIFGRFNGLHCDPVEQCPPLRPKPL